MGWTQFPWPYSSFRKRGMYLHYHSSADSELKRERQEGKTTVQLKIWLWRAVRLSEARQYESTWETSPEGGTVKLRVARRADAAQTHRDAFSALGSSCRNWSTLTDSLSIATCAKSRLSPPLQSPRGNIRRRGNKRSTQHPFRALLILGIPGCPPSSDAR